MERSCAAPFQQFDFVPRLPWSSSISPNWSSDSDRSTLKDFEMVGLAAEPGQPPQQVNHQQNLPSNADQWNLPSYTLLEFSQLSPLPATPCSSAHGKGTEPCCAQFHEEQKEEVKKNRRQEQNRANQRAFRARQDRVMEKLKEDYAKLEEEYGKLHVSYSKQAEKTFFLESKLRENTRNGICSNCLYRFNQL